MIWEVDDGVKDVEGLDEDGRPDPEYAAALGLVPAPKGRRALASLIEFTLFALILTPFAIWVMPMLVLLSRQDFDWYGLVKHPGFVFTLIVAIVTVVLVVAFALVQGLLHGKKGVTIGKAMMGLRSIRVTTLEKPGFGRATLRGLLLTLSWLLPVIGPALFLMSPLFDPERRGRGWLDMAAGTWFVDIRQGLDPFHKKRMRIARKEVKLELNAAREPLPSLATEKDSDEAAYRPRGRVSAGVIGGRRPTADVEPARSAPVAPAPVAPAPVAPVESKRPTSAPEPRAEPASPARRPRTPSGRLVTAAPRADDAAAETIQASDASALIAEAERDESPTGAVVVFDDGTSHSVHGPTLIGRSPDGDDELVRLPDTTRSVSKTHLRIVPDAGGVMVTDMDSKNGVRLLTGRDWSRIPKGEPQFVAIGEEVRFGDRALTVEGSA